MSLGMRTRVERTNVEKRLRRVADAYGRVLVLVVAALPAGVAAGAADVSAGTELRGTPEDVLVKEKPSE